MLKRKIDRQLSMWKKDPDHKPLIIKGARQTGKTTSILAFAKDNYESTVLINFYEHPEYKQIFSEGYNPDAVIRNISLIDPSLRFIPKSTLIFFDEIQEFMDATTSLKFFSIDGRYDVICSGSSLGVHYHNVSSVSVGYKNDMDMYSLDFEEFLWACGYGSDLIAQIENHMLNLQPFSNLMMDRMEHCFMDYLMTGGMPAIVDRFIKTKNFSGLLEMQKQLVKDYDDDIGKYTDGLESARIRNIYRHIAPQLGKDNHKFQVTKLGHGARAYQYQACEEWLSDAGVINNCYCVKDLTFPLKGNEKTDNFRMYFADTSLLLASLDDESQFDLRANKNLGVYKGAMYENFAAEAFVKQGLGLWFYRSDNGRIELDFLVRHNNTIIPIEIKAGKAPTRSLDSVIHDHSFEYIHCGIKFGRYNIGADNDIITFPFFCLFALKRVLNSRDPSPLNDAVNSAV